MFDNMRGPIRLKKYTSVTATYDLHIDEASALGNRCLGFRIGLGFCNFSSSGWLLGSFGGLNGCRSLCHRTWDPRGCQQRLYWCY